MNSIDPYCTKLVNSLNKSYVDQLVTVTESTSLLGSLYVAISSNKVLTASFIAASMYAIYFVLNRFKVLGGIVKDAADNQVTISQTQTSAVEGQKISDEQILSISDNQKTMATIVERHTTEIHALQTRTNELSSAVNANARVLENTTNNSTPIVISNTNNQEISTVLDLISQTNDVSTENQSQIQAINSNVKKAENRIMALESKVESLNDAPRLSVVSNNSNREDVANIVANSAERREITNVGNQLKEAQEQISKSTKETKAKLKELSNEVDVLKSNVEQTNDTLTKKCKSITNRQDSLLSTQEVSTQNIETILTVQKETTKEIENLNQSQNTIREEFSEFKQKQLLNNEAYQKAASLAETNVNNLQTKMDETKTTQLGSIEENKRTFKLITKALKMIKGIKEDNAKLQQELDNTQLELANTKKALEDTKTDVVNIKIDQELTKQKINNVQADKSDEDAASNTGWTSWIMSKNS